MLATFPILLNSPSLHLPPHPEPFDLIPAPSHLPVHSEVIHDTWELVIKFLKEKNSISSISGVLNDETSQCTLMFRAKDRSCHSLDFPIDIERWRLPEFDVLISNSEPSRGLNGPLYYPPSLPISTSLDLLSTPILDAIRTALFPSIPSGQFLIARKEQLEIIPAGARLYAPEGTFPFSSNNRVATVYLTLPSYFTGGVLNIWDNQGHNESYSGIVQGNEIPWVAFKSSCGYEVEMVRTGVKVSLCFGVYLKSLGASDFARPLLGPGDLFLDTLTKALNVWRGRKLAFYLSHSYGVNPAQALAESLAPKLIGQDCVLYHAMKLFHLRRELHWYINGYLWPIDRTIDIFSMENRPKKAAPPVLQGPFATDTAQSNVHGDIIRTEIEQNGGVGLEDADILLCHDWEIQSVVGKEHLPVYVSGELEKISVHALLVCSW